MISRESEEMMVSDLNTIGKDIDDYEKVNYVSSRFSILKNNTILMRTS